ncbi:MAG: 30S ribosomal protein S12 methylthiotransferase RimO [Candidatus Aenigmarchaeota archaeon]|nr:30S ribosomal protein S12 methylthiotransferase RimO [Candidatus Aenigmarchaeota archaeon]
MKINEISKINKKSKIGLISLGCPKNLVDSEYMLGILRQKGFEITLDTDKADIVIINTCSFINKAETESVKTIMSFIESVKNNKKVIIAGCLAQKYKKELQEAIPEAAAFIGTGDFSKIGDVVDRIISKEKSIFEVSQNPDYEHIENIKRFHITVGAGSYIKIAEGCDYSYSFCIIPSLKGKYKSRTMESIIKEATVLGKNGVNEIILIAQDTVNYGKDIYGKPSLPTLLEKLNNIEEISWIRIMYFYPSFVDDELLNTIAKLEKVVKYIDIPLQHSHPEILKLMRRPCFDNGKLIEKIREKVPDAAIRTAFITGFPGENEEHFEHLYNFVEKYKFDKLGIFQYSREKNTPSGSMKGQIPAKIKNRRKNELMKLQQKISKKINTSLIGKNLPCIIETIISKNKIIGRSYRDAPEIDGLVYIKTNEILNPGDIVNVKITDATEYDLYGCLSKH